MKRFLWSWRRRTRAALAVGLTWAAGWSAAGFLLARVPGFDSDLPFALFFGPLGFATGVIFSGIVVAIEGRRFDLAPLSHFVAWGALSGLLLSGIIVAAAALRGENWWGELLLFGPRLAVASAASGGGSLALATRSKRWRSLLVQLGADGPGGA